MVKKIFLIILILFVFSFLGMKGLQMRKEIQSQEIIPLDRGIAVVTGSNYLIPRMKIAIEGKDTRKEKYYDQQGVCKFDGLSNGETYTIRIGRTDLKGRILYKEMKVTATPRKDGTEYFVLVGASIGKAWRFEELPARLHLKPEIVLGNRTRYEFDKSAEITRLSRLSIPISGAIIKECAAFFPREISSSKKLVKNWVDKLRQHHIRPILATVAPVTNKIDQENPGKLSSILEFNNFIRAYASSEGIPVLDLEKALSVGEGDRHLRHEYAASDGLHLLPRAYKEVLDNIVAPIIKGESKTL